MAKLAVLMPVYNSERYLHEAIDSILSQSFTDFNFYIVNDGSTDTSEQIILSFKDPRIKYLKKDQNSGIVDTLNLGLENIQEQFIARMDADDIALKDRLKFQVELMESSPSIVVSGTQIKLFGDSDKISELPVKDHEMRAFLLFHSPMAHPSIIMRTSVLKDKGILYEKTYPHLEDYYMWIRLSEHGTLSNINSVQLLYRLEGQNITSRNTETREKRLKEIYRIHLGKLHIDPNEKNLDMHFSLGLNGPLKASITELYQYRKLLLEQNAKHHVCDQHALSDLLDKYWSKLFYKAADKGFMQSLSYFFVSRKAPLDQMIYALKKSIKLQPSF